MTTIGLTMIVKDAADTLPRLLETLPPGTDPARSTIIDTGSTDSTRNIIRDWGAERIRLPWVSFEHNRNELMALAAGRADYLLLLDADMEMEWNAPLEPLEADLCMAQVHTGAFSYPLPILVSGSHPWEYRGAAHATLYPGEGRTEVQAQNLTSFLIRDHSVTGKDKYVRDIDALWEELRRDKFANPRAWYYLAQSYRDLGETQQAIACFTIRMTAGGMEEERWASAYLAGLMMIEQNYTAGAQMLLQAYQMRPSRAEPLRVLAAFSDQLADTLPVPEGEVLPVRREFYGPRDT